MLWSWLNGASRRWLKVAEAGHRSSSVWQHVSSSFINSSGIIGQTGRKLTNTQQLKNTDSLMSFSDM
ncbi:hypothetical protein F2Q68_00026676 [Brassica cretica]|uniref:Uncharacterized protein n=1 Tax=Brassica cretica TaxID=69181 RepID=A0A8S9IJ45_BRACR|nr:hypothetical protein F2Q68_00026676 [Brassica cretica]